MCLKMSMWVHVAAVVRVDSFGPVSDEQIENIFGKECLWEDDREVWDHMRDFPEQYLPMGSEGSLQMSVWHNHRECDVPSTTVTIFGDLRDKDNAEYLVSWFKEKCDLCDKKFKVRQAVITVNAEYMGITTYTYNDPNLEDNEDTDDE